MPLLLALPMAPAAAQSRPPLLPTRDVAVDYVASGSRPDAAASAPAGGTRVEARFSGSKLRLRPERLPGYVLVDAAAGTATLVLDGLQTATPVPGWSEHMRDMLLNDRMRFTRRGTDRVAGLACTVWAVQVPQGGDGEICETADGVVLRGRGQDPRYGAGRFEATAVTYGPQPASLFRPPDGTQNLDLRALLKGLAGGLRGQR